MRRIFSFPHNISLTLLAFAFAMIHVFKIGISFIPYVLPYHLAPFVFVCILTFFTLQVYREKIFWILASALTIYSLPNIIVNSHLDMLVAKFVIAAFTTLIFSLSLKRGLKSPTEWESFTKLMFLLLRCVTILVFTTSILSLIISEIQNPLAYHFSDWSPIFRFSRENQDLRSDLLFRLNLAYTIRKNSDLMMLQGPQTLIFPFLFTILAYLFPKTLKIIWIDKILITLLVIAIFIFNSRAMALFFIFLNIYAYLPKWRNSRLLSMGLMLFPWLLTLLNNRFLNGRRVQINFTLDNLTFWGHGIGNGLRTLQSLASSYSFDNIHMEILHYFGIIGYSIAISAFVFYSIIRPCSQRLFISFIFFVFLGLNFNLFDPYFILPVMLLLTQQRFCPQDVSRRSEYNLTPSPS